MSRTEKIFNIIENTPNPPFNANAVLPAPTTRDTIGDSTVSNLFPKQIISSKAIVGTGGVSRGSVILKKDLSFSNGNTELLVKSGTTVESTITSISEEVWLTLEYQGYYYTVNGQLSDIKEIIEI